MGIAFNRRLRVAGVHFGISAIAVAFAWLLVFKLWYPPPFATIAGGASLFVLLMSVDLIVGPALTAVVASPRKHRSELVRDLSVIALLQLCAFGYGLYSMALARPVVVAFEMDLMRVVMAADVDDTTLSKALPELQQISWTGPVFIAAVKPTNPDEQLRSIELGIAGVPLAALPTSWRTYASQSDAAWRAARPVSALLAKYPGSTADIARIASALGKSSDGLRFLPLVTRQTDWVVLLAQPDSRVVGYLPLEGFF